MTQASLNLFNNHDNYIPVLLMDPTMAIIVPQTYGGSFLHTCGKIPFREEQNHKTYVEL